MDYRRENKNTNFAKSHKGQTVVEMDRQRYDGKRHKEGGEEFKNGKGQYPE